ncbi:MAG: hypothetical protein K8I02_04920 [Candidatus Methylomirabilis sp.]|nr:hypothetical protein [Deltaproteobacteria bacterium]
MEAVLFAIVTFSSAGAPTVVKVKSNIKRPPPRIAALPLIVEFEIRQDEFLL